MLVVHLHAQRSVHRLRDFGNRGGRLVADLVGVDERDPGHQDTPCLPLLVVLEKPRALSSRMTSSAFTSARSAPIDASPNHSI
jgi:hypothetical protein